ncbi:hypothetical protein [Nocardia sp. NPDC046763]|uniref:hypothetical protein n=1 Tax=Nocardia sp. NPDC046763 TaxID=3155256 RepID=UPI0033EF804F
MASADTGAMCTHRGTQVCQSENDVPKCTQQGGEGVRDQRAGLQDEDDCADAGEDLGSHALNDLVTARSAAPRWLYPARSR